MQTVDENTSGMCKAMREIQEDFAEKDRLISRYQQESRQYQQESRQYQQESIRYQQENSRYQQENSRYQQEILRLQKILRERGVEF